MKKLKGIYVLIIQVNEGIDVDVGAKGEIAFRKGLYAYVGSAQTNLEKRIKRHFGKDKPKFWHVDYLLNNGAARIVKVFFKNANKTEECAIAKVIGEKGEPIDGFGCSDCQCKSHLFHIKDYNFLQGLIRMQSVRTLFFRKDTAEPTAHNSKLSPNVAPSTDFSFFPFNCKQSNSQNFLETNQTINQAFSS